MLGLSSTHHPGRNASGHSDQRPRIDEMTLVTLGLLDGSTAQHLSMASTYPMGELTLRKSTVSRCLGFIEF